MRFPENTPTAQKYFPFILGSLPVVLQVELLHDKGVLDHRFRQSKKGGNSFFPYYSDQDTEGDDDDDGVDDEVDGGIRARDVLVMRYLGRKEEEWINDGRPK